jgi:hypothetical protein
MRYRVTLKDSAHDYFAVIFQNYDEPEFPKDKSSKVQRKLFSISMAYQNLQGELAGQSAFSIITIEEAPEEISSSSFGETQTEPNDDPL